MLIYPFDNGCKRQGKAFGKLVQNLETALRIWAKLLNHKLLIII